MKSRRQPQANSLAAAQTHILCHAAYIAFQLGRKLRFDPAKDAFIGDDEATGCGRGRCESRGGSEEDRAMQAQSPITASNPGPLPGSNTMNALVMRPFQDYNTINDTANVCNNRFDSLQISLNKRFGNRLTFQAPIPRTA